MNMRRDSSSPPAPQNDRLNNPHQSPFRKVGSAQLAIKLFLLYLYKRLVRVHGVSYLDEYLPHNAAYGRVVEDSMRGLVLRFLFERLGLELAGVPLLEELHGHYREEGIREHVIYGFCLAVYVPHHLVELRLKQVSRPAGDGLLVAYGELSRGLVYGAGRLAVEPLEVVPGLARYYLVSLAHEHVERRLRAHDLARGGDERRVSHVLPDPGYLVEDLVHLIEGVLFPQLICEVRYHASGYLDDQRLGVDGRVLALEPLVLLPYLPEPVRYLGELAQVKAR